MSKPKLLLISAISPFPQTSGGATRIKQTIFHLSKKYDVYLFFFADTDHILNVNEKEFLGNHTVFFEPIISQAKSVKTSLRSGLPYHFSNYFSQILIDKLIQIQQRVNFDEIRIEFSQLLYLEKYLKKKTSVKFIAHDISMVSFWRRAFESLNPLTILMRLMSCLQVYLYEKKHLSKFKKIVVMSVKDRDFAQKFYKIKNLLISPNGIKEINFLPQESKKILTIGYIGSSFHSPNKVAIKYLLEKILPQFVQKKLNIKILILGKNNREICQIKNNFAKVEFIEYMDNLENFYSQIDVLVAPIFSGSGTRIKVLESLSYGRPVITTEVGAEGLAIQSKFLTIISKHSQFLVENWVKNIVSISKSKDELKDNLKDLEKQLPELTWKNIFSKE